MASTNPTGPDDGTRAVPVPASAASSSTTSSSTTSGTTSRDSIARPGDEEIVYRVDDHDAGPVARERRFDLLATLGGALAALGTLLLLSSLIGTGIGAIGYQTGVADKDLSIGGLVGGVVVLFLACLVGGWVAGRIAHRRGALHGVVAILWLVVLAAVLVALAAAFGDDLDVTNQVGLPSWFSQDAFTTTAIITGVVSLLAALLGGWLGGKLADRNRRSDTVSLVETRRGVRERDGGIIDGRNNDVRNTDVRNTDVRSNQ